MQQQEIDALKSLAKIGSKHAEDLGELMPVMSAAGAERIHTRVLATINALEAAEADLEKAVSGRLSEQK